jgi:hypothetical protein
MSYRSIIRAAGRAVLLSLCVLAATRGAFAQASTAPAAQSASTTVGGLTINGKKSIQSHYVRALKFVQSHGTPAAKTGQLARWSDAICPVTLGLSPAMNAFVSARVAALAAEVGAPVAKRAGCRPNVEILFTDQPQTLVKRVARKQSAFLGYHDASQTASLVTFSRPIQAWYLTGTQNNKGQRSVDVSEGKAASELGVTQTNGGLQALEQMAQTPEGCADSHFTRCLSSLFVNVLIVADQNALSGRQIGPVADYVAMLALTQPRSFDGCDALPSILDLLSTKCGDRSEPDGVTDNDVAYLRALYRVNLESMVWVQTNAIAGRMVNDKGAAASGDRK